MGRVRGFTIVEVILFLAISTVLLGMAVSYTSNSLKQARYNDTAKGFESFIEQAYAEVQAGTATRTSGAGAGSCPTVGVAAGASDNCIVLGRLLSFDTAAGSNKLVAVHTVVANATPSSPPAGDIDAFSKHNTRVQETTAVHSYKMDWGTEISSARYMGGLGTAAFNRLAILRSPVTESIYLFTFSSVTAPTSGASLIADLTADKANKQSVICFTSSDHGTGDTSLVASVVLSGSSGIDSISSMIRPKTAVRVGTLAC